MDDTIAVLRERATDAFDRFRTTARQLQEKYQSTNFPDEKKEAARKIYLEIGHDIRALDDTFELSLRTPESWQRFFSGRPGSLDVRHDHLAALPEEFPDLITPQDIKPLLDRLLVIRRLGEYALKRMGVQDAGPPAIGIC